MRTSLLCLFTLLPSVCWPNCFHQIWLHMGPSVDVISFSPFSYKPVAAEKRGLWVDQRQSMCCGLELLLESNEQQWVKSFPNRRMFLYQKKRGRNMQAAGVLEICLFSAFLYGSLFIPFWATTSLSLVIYMLLTSHLLLLLNLSAMGHLTHMSTENLPPIFVRDIILPKINNCFFNHSTSLHCLCII